MCLFLSIKICQTRLLTYCWDKSLYFLQNKQFEMVKFNWTRTHDLTYKHLKVKRRRNRCPFEFVIEQTTLFFMVTLRVRRSFGGSNCSLNGFIAFCCCCFCCRARSRFQSKGLYLRCHLWTTIIVKRHNSSTTKQS